MGRIYTSYFGHHNSFPINSLTIGITRFPPNATTLNLDSLAPSAELLMQFKNKEVDEYIFKQKYFEELRERGLDARKVRAVFEEWNRDIILCCYEKPNEFCHRHLLAEWLGGDIPELS